MPCTRLLSMLSPMTSFARGVNGLNICRTDCSDLAPALARPAAAPPERPSTARSPLNLATTSDCHLEGAQIGHAKDVWLFVVLGHTL